MSSPSQPDGQSVPQQPASLEQVQQYSPGAAVSQSPHHVQPPHQSPMTLQPPPTTAPQPYPHQPQPSPHMSPQPGAYPVPPQQSTAYPDQSPHPPQPQAYPYACPSQPQPYPYAPGPYAAPSPQYGTYGFGSGGENGPAQKPAGSVDYSRGVANWRGLVSGGLFLLLCGLDAGYAFYLSSGLPSEWLKSSISTLLLLWRILPIVVAVWVLLFMIVKPLNRPSMMPSLTALPVLALILPHAWFVKEAPEFRPILYLLLAILEAFTMYGSMSYNQHRLSFTRSWAFYHYCPPS